MNDNCLDILMISKRGLSGIVATVLIVLLALAAVGIVWTFVSPVLSGNSGTAQAKAECFAIDLEAVSATFSSTAGPDVDTLKVLVKRNSGGDVIDEIRFVLEGKAISFDKPATTLAELGTVEFTMDSVNDFTLGGVASGDTVLIAPVLLTGDDLEVVCDVEDSVVVA
jgi:hypothetical protein